MGATKRDKLFDPRYCSYKLNKKRIQHLNRLIKSQDVADENKKHLVEFKNQYLSSESVANYHSLTELHKFLQRADPDYSDPFYVLLESCKCIEQHGRSNKQLDQRLKQLGWKMSQKLYDHMTASVDRSVEDKIDREIDSNPSAAIISGTNSITSNSNTNEIRKLHGSAVAVFNSFMVYICTFIFFYKALEYALPVPNVIAQVALGLLASTVVGVAELYFIFRVV